MIFKVNNKMKIFVNIIIMEELINFIEKMLLLSIKKTIKKIEKDMKRDKNQLQIMIQKIMIEEIMIEKIMIVKIMIEKNMIVPFVEGLHLLCEINLTVYKNNEGRFVCHFKDVIK